MLKNYLKIAFRNLWKNKLFSGINIFGLAAAIGTSLLLLLTAMQQFSYDRFHEKGSRIYRAYFEAYRSRGQEFTANMPVPLQPRVQEEVAAVESAIRWRGGGATVEVGGEQFRANIRYTDPGFFEVFSFKLLEGEESQVLQAPHSIILSERAAIRFFGGTDGVVGRELKVVWGNGPQSLQVTGLAQDPPEESSLDYEIITRFENAPDFRANEAQWDNYNHGLFVLLKENTDVATAEAQMANLIGKYFTSTVEQIKNDGGQAPDGGAVYRLKLQPLQDIHFDRTIARDGVSKAFPIGLLIGALFILGIACINFVNLSLGSSLTRAREVGVRKVLGASRRQLIFQFWGEAVLLTGIALLIGLALAQLLLPEFNSMFRSSIQLSHPRVILAVGLLLAAIGLFGGGYPALALSRFQAASVLKGDTGIQRPGRLRNLLVLAQFAISVLLISCTIIVGQQLDFLRNKALGYNEEEVLSIPLSPGMDGHQVLERLRNELAPHPKAQSLAGAYNNFGRGLDGSIYTSVIGFLQDEKELYTHLQVAGYGFLETLEIPLVEGHNFSKEFPTDTAEAILVNEMFTRQLGEGPHVGKVLQMDPPRKIVGVMKDFHFQSLENPIEPMSVVLATSGWDFPINYIFVRISPESVTETMALLESTWKEIAPKATFQASFLNENTNRLYMVEKIMGQLFMAAASLAIILSCMGLFGIAVLSIAQRTKEVGIRKVLGASVGNIVTLLSRDFMRMVGIGIVLAIPLGWLAMHKWLENYAYRIEIGWWVFLLAGLLAVGIAFLTLSVQSVRAATANPVDALRSE